MSFPFLLAPDPTQVGTGPKDFCNSTPGEPVVLGSTCGNGYPGDACGCRRSFKGVESRKATTIGVVGFVERTARELAIRDLKGFGNHDPSPEDIQDNTTEIESISRLVSQYPIGTRLCVSMKGEEPAIVRPAGEISRDWGI